MFCVALGLWYFQASFAEIASVRGHLARMLSCCNMQVLKFRPVSRHVLMKGLLKQTGTTGVGRKGRKGPLESTIDDFDERIYSAPRFPCSVVPPKRFRRRHREHGPGQGRFEPQSCTIATNNARQRYAGARMDSDVVTMCLVIFVLGRRHKGRGTESSASDDRN